METTAPAIAKVGVRIPEFCPGDPEMWFSMVERSFEASGITTEATKFGYVLGALTPQYATEVRDIIINPPPTTPFSKLKEELIRRIGVSQDQKTRRLLEREEIGDRKPSQFLRHLRGLAGTTAPDSVLRTLWVSRLPTNMQVILATQKDTELNKVADLADAIADTTTPRAHICDTGHPGPSSHSAVTPVNPDTELLLNARMAQMTLSLRQEISELKELIYQDRGRQSRPFYHRRSNSRNRSPSGSRDRGSRRHNEYQAPPDYNGKCWYHWRYGGNAHKCVSPCNFSGSAAGNDQGGR
ncbi:uncharacterized protein LOC143363853 [Halictus rubicundus]|uniref:uncharacterized protein LOC143363853 n=1 Tax=Halictus rubicundus TaxID=77578 RepID=UPI0040368131